MSEIVDIDRVNTMLKYGRHGEVANLMGKSIWTSDWYLELFDLVSRPKTRQVTQRISEILSIKEKSKNQLCFVYYFNGIFFYVYTMFDFTLKFFIFLYLTVNLFYPFFFAYYKTILEFNGSIKPGSI
jgi:hypothetical protein